MRFVIIDADYPEFLQLMYEQRPELRKLPYEDQLRFRTKSLVGTADFYSSNLRKLGHEAENIWINNEALQRAWAREHGVAVGNSWEWNFRLRRGLVPWVSRVGNDSWMYEILAAQIKLYKPDVLINKVVGFVSPSFLCGMKPYIRLLIGRVSPVAVTYGERAADYRRAYDLVIAASEGMVDYFRSQGMKSELFRNAFEPRVLSEASLSTEKPFAVNFAGILRGNIYSSRRSLVENVCSIMGREMHVWSTSLEDVPMGSPTRNCYEGHAWGKPLYRALSQSKIVLNCHADIDTQYAENYRLYEATGMGACLLTDWKSNLSKIFDVGEEVLAYKSADECIEMIRYHLDHDSEREAVAKAGQKRTLRDYTFRHWARGLCEIAERSLCRERATGTA